MEEQSSKSRAKAPDRVLLSVVAGAQFLLSIWLLVTALFTLGYGAASVGAFNPVWLFLGIAGALVAYFVERGRTAGRIFGAVWHGVFFVTLLAFGTHRLKQWAALIPYALLVAVYLGVTAWYCKE